MPKIIELTVEIDIVRVSCPGVWLCQDGRVSLTVFALGTNYQTCLLPPMFPLMFKDIFYFRKRFQESCAVNNMCCLLKEETIYCELVQWTEDCNRGECTLLAQYLGALNDVLFPPNMCSNDGVDLLMRRAKDFPGILSPKIEITTKVRIDEIWNTESGPPPPAPPSCACAPDRDSDGTRQRQVCHTPQYHRHKCFSAGRRPSCEGRARSECSRSVCSLPKEPDDSCRCPNTSKQSEKETCECTNSPRKTEKYACNEASLNTHCRRSPCRPYSAPRGCYRRHTVCNVEEIHDSLLDDKTELDDERIDTIHYPQHPGSPDRRLHGSRSHLAYNVYNVKTGDTLWMKYKNYSNESDTTIRSTDTEKPESPTEEKLQKILLESRYIEQEISRKRSQQKFKKIFKPHVTPCVCEICKRYHELFHTTCTKVDRKF